MLLSGQYSITAYYVKSESAAAQERRVHKGGAFDVQLRHEETNITGEKAVKDIQTQLNDTIIESHAGFHSWSIELQLAPSLTC